MLRGVAGILSLLIWAQLSHVPDVRLLMVFFVILAAQISTFPDFTSSKVGNAIKTSNLTNKEEVWHWHGCLVL